MSKLLKINIYVYVKDVELVDEDYYMSDSPDGEVLADVERRIVIKDTDYDSFIDDRLWEILHFMSDRAAIVARTS